IFGGSYGWSSAGRFHHAQSQLKRFLNAAGGFVRAQGNYSYNAALVLMPHVVGNFHDQVKGATRWSSVAQHGELVVAFGGLPLRNAQVSGGGVGRHRLGQQLRACAAAGVRFVNFSPLRNDAMAELDAEWLAPRPGSDTSIMLALAHTLLVEGLHDQAFLKRYARGFAEVEAYLRGAKDGVEKSAEWASALSDIPAERIRSLAREMASSRTLVSCAAALQRAENGEQPLWATVTLAAMLGQIGLPGGGFGIGYAADASIGTMTRPMPWPSLPQGENPVDEFIPVATIADMLLNPGATYQYNGSTRTFPHCRLVWWAGGNPFHHHQDLNRLRAAFQRPETIIVNEIFWTGTARHADIVLPVTSSLERTDFAAGTQDNALIPMPRVSAPPEHVRDEYDIFCDLERRLGLGTSFSAGRTQAEWLTVLWEQMRATARGHNVELPDYETFIAGDIIYLDDPAPDAVYLSEFRNAPETAKLATPSGKIELFSETIAGFDYADCPGQATWIPPREWLGAATPEAPLHLISGQPGTRLHGQFDAGRFSRAQKIQGREPLLIHPDDAGPRGIGDGEVVRISNARGQCLAGAVVTTDVRPGVVFLWTGATYDPDLTSPTHLERHGNPNVLTHDFRTSRLAQGPAAQSALVEVARFADVPPPVQAFIPPLSDGPAAR
ncbi:MAG: molybdopterin-dependent oxidoreductase, partial [Pseudomonadota bacterium]